MEQKVEQALKEKGIDHVQVVIECCGLKSTSEEAFDIVDRQGTVILLQ